MRTQPVSHLWHRAHVTNDSVKSHSGFERGLSIDLKHLSHSAAEKYKTQTDDAQ